MTNICKFYLKGNCKQRDNCQYIHDSKICKFFFFNGSCKKGSECQFNHNFRLNEKGISVPVSPEEQNNTIPLSELSIEEPITLVKVETEVVLKEPISNHSQNSKKSNDNNRHINYNDRRNNEKSDNNDNNRNNNNRNDNNNNRHRNNYERRNNEKSDNYDNNRNVRQNNDRQNNDRQNNKRKHKKNTENFNPSHEHLDMNILVGLGTRKLRANDVVVYPNFLNEPSPGYFYDKLISEMEQSGVSQDDLWKLWHGDSHLIADDHIGWKKKVPTFGYIIDEIKRIFKVDVKSTRFNWYRDTNEWKPFHFDAAAVKEDKAATQNITVGLSLGRTREVAFEHAKTRTTVCIPLPNNTVYSFSKNVNIEWRHGIPQVPPEEYEEKGRISIIAWGWTDMDDFPSKK